MENLLRQSWWMLALRGVAAIVFGVLAIFWPGATLLVLVALFAAFAIVSGGTSIFAAVRHRGADGGWWLVLALGIVAVIAGVLAIFRPGVTALVLVLVMGAYAILTGVLDIAIAIRLRREIQGEWLLVLAGIVAVIFGVVVMAFPAAGAFALVWMVAFYAIASGVLLLALGIRLRSRGRPSQPPSGHPGTAAPA